MRILLVTDALPDPPRGGLDLHVRELAAGLAERGHDVDLQALAGAAPDAIGEGDGPGGALARSLADGPLLDAFVGRVRETEPDVVHFHNLQGLSHRMPTLARREGARVVWTHHDLFALCQRVHLHDGDGAPCSGPRSGAACGPCFGGLRGLLAAPVFGLRHLGFLAALQATHAHVAPSAWVRDILCSEPISPERVHVLPPAEPAPGRLAEAPGEGPPRLLVAGDLRRAKGPDLVLEAFARLRQPASLVVAGGPPAPPAPREDDLEARLHDLAAGRDVRFTGRYPPRGLLGLLDGAAALIVGSRVRETFGRTANLALQAGVPVVAPAEGGFPDFIRPGVNGLLYAPRDGDALGAAMEQVLADGLLMQADAPSWAPPALNAHIDGLLALYQARG